MKENKGTSEAAEMVTLMAAYAETLKLDYAELMKKRDDSDAAIERIAKDRRTTPEEVSKIIHVIYQKGLARRRKERIEALKQEVLFTARTKCECTDTFHRGRPLGPCVNCGAFLGSEDFMRPAAAPAPANSKYEGTVEVEAEVNGKKTKVAVERKVVGHMIEITCIDCGAKRQCHPQDAWQVKRCKPCQEVFKKKKHGQFIASVSKKPAAQVGTEAHQEIERKSRPILAKPVRSRVDDAVTRQQAAVAKAKAIMAARAKKK